MLCSGSQPPERDSVTGPHCFAHVPQYLFFAAAQQFVNLRMGEIGGRTTAGSKVRVCIQYTVGTPSSAREALRSLLSPADASFAAPISCRSST